MQTVLYRDHNVHGRSQVTDLQELPRQPLYRVTFHQSHVWEGYTGNGLDTVDVEIYQAWLLPATQEQLESQQQGKHNVGPCAYTHQHGQQGPGKQHDGAHGSDLKDHTHEERSVVEQNAVDKEGEDDAERRRLSEALVKVTQDWLCQG